MLMTTPKKMKYQMHFRVEKLIKKAYTPWNFTINISLSELNEKVDCCATQIQLEWKCHRKFAVRKVSTHFFLLHHHFCYCSVHSENGKNRSRRQFCSSLCISFGFGLMSRLPTSLLCPKLSFLFNCHRQRICTSYALLFLSLCGMKSHID